MSYSINKMPSSHKQTEPRKGRDRTSETEMRQAGPRLLTLGESCIKTLKNNVTMIEGLGTSLIGYQKQLHAQVNTVELPDEGDSLGDRLGQRPGAEECRQ